ncbi:MAG: MBL fold metallo-hydrolase [Candidatus Binatia bacterium]
MPRQQDRRRASGTSPSPQVRGTGATASATGVPPTAQPAGQVRLTVLGSGDAFGARGRAHSAYLVEAPGTTFLVDCGPSVLQSMKRIARAPEAVDFVLLSHLHGDHFGGVPFLFMEYRYVSRRTRPLGVLGPPGTERRVRALFGALYENTAAEDLPFPVEYVELPAGVATGVGPVRVLPAVVPHTQDLVCYGFRVEVAGKSFVYSGDTAWTDDLARLAAGADLFVCECSTYETRLDIHIAYPEIAARAAGLTCRRLLLSHLGEEVLRRLDEISLTCAEDGMTIVL